MGRFFAVGLGVLALGCGGGGRDQEASAGTGSAGTASVTDTGGGSSGGSSGGADDTTGGPADAGSTSGPTTNADAATSSEGSSSSSGGLEGALEIYWVDTEGGAATLLVTPGGALVLVDAGNPGDRDPDRIAAVIQDEIGAEQIDLCIVTHYHSDHVGGVPGVDQRVPIAAFWDHGASVEAGGGGGQMLYDAYVAVAEGKRTTVAPGESHDVGGVLFQIVAANGVTTTQPLPGGDIDNPACRGASNLPPASDENAMSVGFVASWGSFDFLDLGDLTWSFEDELACRVNQIGAIDLYQTTHHGLSISGATQLVHGINPVVAVMNNGPHKGGAPQTFDIVTGAPSMPDLWMLHRALDTDAAHNSADDLIANPGEGNEDEAHFIHARIDAAGTITIRNSRNGHQRGYQAK